MGVWRCLGSMIERSMACRMPIAGSATCNCATSRSSRPEALLQVHHANEVRKKYRRSLQDSNQMDALSTIIPRDLFPDFTHTFLNRATPQQNSQMLFATHTHALPRFRDIAVQHASLGIIRMYCNPTKTPFATSTVSNLMEISIRSHQYPVEPCGGGDFSRFNFPVSIDSSLCNTSSLSSKLLLNCNCARGSSSHRFDHDSAACF